MVGEQTPALLCDAAKEAEDGGTHTRGSRQFLLNTRLRTASHPLPVSHIVVYDRHLASDRWKGNVLLRNQRCADLAGGAVGWQLTSRLVRALGAAHVPRQPGADAHVSQVKSPHLAIFPDSLLKLLQRGSIQLPVLQICVLQIGVLRVCFVQGGELFTQFKNLPLRKRHAWAPSPIFRVTQPSRTLRIRSNAL